MNFGRELLRVIKQSDKKHQDFYNACAMGQTTLVKLLLGELKTSPDCSDYQLCIDLGLQLAVLHEQANAVKFLVHSKANWRRLSEEDLRTVISYETRPKIREEMIIFLVSESLQHDLLFPQPKDSHEISHE